MQIIKADASFKFQFEVNGCVTFFKDKNAKPTDIVRSYTLQGVETDNTLPTKSRYFLIFEGLKVEITGNGKLSVYQAAQTTIWGERTAQRVIEAQ